MSKRNSKLTAIQDAQERDFGYRTYASMGRCEIGIEQDGLRIECGQQVQRVIWQGSWHALICEEHFHAIFNADEAA